MSKAQDKRDALAASVELLRRIFPPETTVRIIIRRVSDMSRTMTVLAPDDTDVTSHVARVLGYPFGPNTFHMRVRGGGMDMAFHVTYSLSHALHGGTHSCLTHRVL